MWSRLLRSATQRAAAGAPSTRCRGVLGLSGTCPRRTLSTAATTAPSTPADAANAPAAAASKPACPAAAATAATAAPAAAASASAAATASAAKRVNIWGLTLTELSAELKDMGVPAYRARQLYTALYRQGVCDPHQLSTLGKPLRTALSQRFDFALPGRVHAHSVSADGTHKWLLQLATLDKPGAARARAIAAADAGEIAAAAIALPEASARPAQAIESVFIPSHDFSKSRKRTAADGGDAAAAAAATAAAAASDATGASANAAAVAARPNETRAQRMQRLKEFADANPGANPNAPALQRTHDDDDDDDGGEQSGSDVDVDGDGGGDDSWFNRGTLCVSSQVGCSLSCAFCHTGTMDKANLRNLSAAEIVGQVVAAKFGIGDFPPSAVAPPHTVTGGGSGGVTSWPGTSVHRDATRAFDHRLLTNVVFMGMGEPLLNYRNVAKALQILYDPNGLALGRRRVTVSTSGIVPAIDRLGRDPTLVCPPNLAISLHAVHDTLRDVLVPINRTYPLQDLLAACRRYPGVRQSRRITFEYVMLKGVNDSDADARQLLRLCHGLPVFINLIPFNPWPGAPFECSSNNAIYRFASVFDGAPHIRCAIRWPRGRDIDGACGQLAVKHLKQQMDNPNAGRLPFIAPASATTATATATATAAAK